MPRNHLGHRESVTRVGDRRRKQVLHGQTAETGMQLEPAIDRARDRHRQRAALGNTLQALFAKIVETQCARRAAAGIEPMQALVSAIPDEREQITADTATGRLHKSERRIGRNCRIHR